MPFHSRTDLNGHTAQMWKCLFTQNACDAHHDGKPGSVGPLFLVYFYTYDSDAFHVTAIHAFCDDPCSDSVQLEAVSDITL